MDSNFVDVIIDTYLNQFDLYESKLPKKREAQKTVLTEEFMGLLRELRDSDIELYDGIYDRDRIMQRNIIYDYLTESWATKKETLGNNRGKIAAIGGLAAGIAGTAGAINYIEDDDSDIVDNDDGIIDKILSVDYKKFFTNPKNLMGIGFAGLLGYIFINSEFVNRKYEKALYKITKSIYKLSKTLKKSRQLTFRYVILKQNFEQCYKKCGLSVDEIRKGHFNWLKPGINRKQRSTQSQSKQVECLKECYLNFHAQTIGLFCANYLLCINTNKEISQKFNFSADDFVLGFEKMPEGNTSCKVLFDTFEQSIDEYKQLAQFLSKLEKRQSTYNDCMELLKKQINKQLLMTRQK